MATTFKLGCRPPRPSQLMRTLQFRKYAKSNLLPPTPPSTNWRNMYVDDRMMANDQLGDCVMAEQGHQLLQWSGCSGNPYTITRQEIVERYFRLTGGADNGLVIIDALDYWRKNSLGGPGNYLHAFLSVTPTDHAAILESIYLFGGICCGVNLPLAWQGADTWTAPSNAHLSGNWAPGSWGGHCVCGLDYDAQYLYVRSWGQCIPVTWAAVTAYFSEMYCCLDKLWVSNFTQKSPSGFDFATLEQDLAVVTSQTHKNRQAGRALENPQW